MSEQHKRGQSHVNLGTILREIQSLEHERAHANPLDAQSAMLRSWQSERLARTYDDFARDPRYQPVMRFFLKDLYGARDFSQRNHDIQRLYELVRRLAPEAMIRPLMLSVELHYLTEQLDNSLLAVLVNKLGVVDVITVPLYAQAYRICNNYSRRLQQIDLIYELGGLIDRTVRMPLSGTVLNLARLPLEKGGWQELMAFMERGYKAFKHLHCAEEFLVTVRKRETDILDRIYAGESDPFEFETSKLTG